MRSAGARFVNYVRHFVPASLMPLIVMIRVRLARHVRALWADAQEQMRWVVGDDQSPEVMERLSLGYLRCMICRGEVRWHPQLVQRQSIAGVERLHALAERDEPFIVCFAHHADYEGVAASLAWAGFPNQLVATSALFADQMPVWMQYSKVVLEPEGVRLLDVARGSQGIKQVLEHGGVVSMAVDVPGRTPGRFLGHEVPIATGAARIALEMNVPLVVITARARSGRSRWGAELVVADVLDPRDFDSARSILDAVLHPLEESIRAWPEAYEYPNRRFDPAIMDTP